MIEEALRAWDAQVRALRQPPSIQIQLHKARELRRVLDAEPGLTRGALATRLGITRPRVTQLLQLLGLPEEVQRAIDELPPVEHPSLLSERRVRALLKLRGPGSRFRAFLQLLEAAYPGHVAKT